MLSSFHWSLSFHLLWRRFRFRHCLFSRPSCCWFCGFNRLRRNTDFRRINFHCVAVTVDNTAVWFDSTAAFACITAGRFAGADVTNVWFNNPFLKLLSWKLLLNELNEKLNFPHLKWPITSSTRNQWWLLFFSLYKYTLHVCLFALIQ